MILHVSFKSILFVSLVSSKTNKAKENKLAIPWILWPRSLYAQMVSMDLGWSRTFFYYLLLCATSFMIYAVSSSAISANFRVFIHHMVDVADLYVILTPVMMANKFN